MNVFSLSPLYRFLNIFKWLFGLIGRILFSRKQKVKESSANDDGNPIEIISVGGKAAANRTEQAQSFAVNQSRNEVPGNNTLTDWNDWKDSSNQEETQEMNLDNIDLFQDMAPKLTRPRMLKVATRDVPQQKPASGFSNRFQVEGTNFEVPTELGNWVENSTGWDEEVLDDLSEEAANILKEKKKIERQRRTIEQKKRKEEMRATRAERKNAPQLGMKLN